MSCFDFCCSDEKFKKEKEEFVKLKDKLVVDTEKFKKEKKEFSKLKQEFVDGTENTFKKAYALVEECYKKYDTLSSENNDLKKKNTTLEQKIRELTSSLDEQEKQCEKMLTLYNQIQEKLNKAYAKLIEEYNANIQRLQLNKVYAKLIEEYNANMQRLQELNKVYAKLIEEYKDNMQRLITENTNLKKKIPECIKINNSKSTKNLPHITIDEKFGKK